MYVITGATGNTGSVAAKQLLARGQKVRVLGRDADRLQPLVKLGAEPFVTDVSDAATLTRAFTGAQAVYALIPPNVQSPDARAYSEGVSDALASAIAKAGIRHAVVLSSVGADKSEKTGPVLGLNHLEKKLSTIAGLNALFLRAGYFMENTLPQAGMIQAMGKTAGPVRADLKLPLIASRDIGNFAADALLKLNFKDKQTQELLGERDLTYTEITSIIGKAINKSDLQYLQLPPEQVQPALEQMGMSENFARHLLEMVDSLNSGYMKALEERSPENTTLTSYETWVAEEFVPVYQQKPKAA